MSGCSGDTYFAITSLTRLVTNWMHEVVKFIILLLAVDDDDEVAEADGPLIEGEWAMAAAAVVRVEPEAVGKADVLPGI